MRTLSFLFALMLLSLPAVGEDCGELVWFDGTNPVSYTVEGRSSAVVGVALGLFAADMAQVTGLAAQPSPRATVRVVQLDQNPGATRRLRALGVPVDSLRGRADAFHVGVHGGAVYVVGQNGRGSAYGVLELSRLAGVSPWVWWGDVVPERRGRLALPAAFSSTQAPSVTYRGIFINDEDWSLRRWAAETSERGSDAGTIGPRTYRRIFELLLRLRANTLWPAMHEGTRAFFAVEGNKAVADSFGILIGTSHCEPLLRNNVAEWDVSRRGPYNYITNRDAVQRYWTERLREVAGSEELFTIGMRGIHDGSMEGVRTPQEKLEGLQQVIDDQRELLRRYINKDVTRVPQVFIPYKEVLEIMESGLRVPDDVTLMWCDDNYGYLTRLPDDAQQQRQGGGGVYYHLSYWGRPHDHLWLTTTQPGLICHEMRAAYDHNCRRLWIANVHDPKVAAFDLELFLDMAWNIDCVQPQTLEHHLQQWLATQFGPQVARGIAPAMVQLCRLNAERRPEFMGWTQVELDKRRYPGGKSAVGQIGLTPAEAAHRIARFGAVEATVDAYARLVPPRLQDAYFAAVLYPVHAAAAMSAKLLATDSLTMQRAYDDIQALTARYNTMNHDKWRGLMSAAPRSLPVFGAVRGTLLADTVPADAALCVARNASDYSHSTASVVPVQMLGHSMSAVPLPKGAELLYEFDTDCEGAATLYTAMIPTQPSDRGDLRYSVQVDDQQPVVVSLKTPYRSETWKQSVLRGQALKATPVSLDRGHHTLRLRALDDHIIADQWMLDFSPGRPFYLIQPTEGC